MKRKAKPVIAGLEQRQFEWRGRIWTILRLTDEEAPRYIGNENVATIQSDYAMVFIKASSPKQLQLQAIFHEFGHELFPEWKVEPSESSASELGIFERDVPALLKALGVDLAPLVDW